MNYIRVISGIPFVVGSVTFNLSQVSTVLQEDETTIYISVGSSFVRVFKHKDSEFFGWVKDIFLIDEAKVIQEKKNVKFFGSTVHVAPLVYQLKDSPKFKNYNLSCGRLEDFESDEPFVGVIVHCTYEKSLEIIKPYLDSSNQSKQPVSVYLLFVNEDIQERTNRALNLLEQAGVKSEDGNYLIDKDTESLYSSIEMMFEMNYE